MELIKFLYKKIPECSNGDNARMLKFSKIDSPHGQMVPTRLCKNKNKEVLKCKKSKIKFKQKEDSQDVKESKTIVAPLIINRKRCKERPKNYWRKK